MNKKIIYILILFAALGVTLFFLLNRGTSPIEVTPEVIETLEQSVPMLSPDDEAYLTRLADNAVSGGPPKDGIPSIDNSQYTSVAEGDEWLLPEDVVFGVAYKDFVAAYPQRILVWHEIVNEEIGGEKISVTYCPLTGTAIGFKGEYAPDISAQFGVSGKLVNSNLIMYDRASDSYWPQVLGRAISGPAKGMALPEFPVVWTTWEKWKTEYPDTLVLSDSTGFFRNYGEGGDPYGSYLSENMGYYSSDRTLFRPLHEDDRLRPKEVVVGIRDKKGHSTAILKDKLRADGVVEAPLGEATVVVSYNESLDFYEARIKETGLPAEASAQAGEWINAFDAMWFAWVAFYPETELLQ